MKWSNLPYWLKGGIIADFFLLLVYGMVIFQLLGKYQLTFLVWFILKPLGPLVSLDSPLISTIPILLLEYFILGAIIGFIVGKIKNRGRKK